MHELFKTEVRAFNRLRTAKLTHIPEFFRALDTYASLRDFERSFDNDKYADEPIIPPVDAWVHKPQPLEEPGSWTLLDSLPAIGLRRIPKEDRACLICTNDFTGAMDSAGWAPVARKLPCGHLFCQPCLERWFSNRNLSQNNTCPTCRRVCFELTPAVDTLDGLQANSDLADLLILAGHEWDEREKSDALWVKKTLLRHYAHAAMGQINTEIRSSDVYRRTGWPPIIMKLASPDRAWDPNTFLEDEVPLFQEYMLRKAMCQYLIIQVARRKAQDEAGENEDIEDLMRQVLLPLRFARSLRCGEDGRDGAIDVNEQFGDRTAAGGGTK